MVWGLPVLEPGRLLISGACLMLLKGCVCGVPCWSLVLLVGLGWVVLSFCFGIGPLAFVVLRCCPS